MPLLIIFDYYISINTMSKPYSKEDMFRPSSEGRSLHDDLSKFLREALHFKTPVQQVLNSKELASYIRKLSDKDKLTHKQFIFDMKATKSIDLWPETDGLPSSKCNFTSMWRAINIHLPPLEHKSGKVISSSSENSEKTKQTTKNSNTTKISKSGRKRGMQNFTKKELECLLDLIEEHKPCGAVQWDLVSSGLYDAGYKSRDRDSCKKNSTDFGKPVNQLVVLKCHYIFVGQKTSRMSFRPMKSLAMHH